MEVKGQRKGKKVKKTRTLQRGKKKKNSERKEDRSTLSCEDRARKRSSKQKIMEELEVTALYSLTLMGTYTHARNTLLDTTVLNH